MGCDFHGRRVRRARRTRLPAADGARTSEAEHKRLTDGQGVEALLSPDPKAECHIDSQSVSAGHYAQALTCPQKRGDPMRISRVGTYDASGFVGRVTVTGRTAKGVLTIALNQRAARVGG